MSHFAEKFEQINLIFFTNSDSSVVYFDNNRVNHGKNHIFLNYCQFWFPQTHFYVTIKGKFGRISQQIDHYLLQTLVITAYKLRTVFCDVFYQLHITFQTQLHSNQLVDFGSKHLQINLLVVHLEFARLELGKIESVIY